LHKKKGLIPSAGRRNWKSISRVMSVERNAILHIGDQEKKKSSQKRGRVDLVH